MKDKMCPIMTNGIWLNQETGKTDGTGVPCQKDDCQFWIEVNTTENIRTSGCCYELHPQMVDGRLRV